MTILKAPMPYFGGKSRAAAAVWERFGKVANYVEPFFGSGAVLLGCPHPGHTETVNDADALLCNFWRALQSDPEQVARYADWPVNETDLHARHRWLVARKPAIKALLDSDPEACDAKAAGWWVWGASAWIGSGWCAASPSIADVRKLPIQLPHVGDAGQGVNRVHSLTSVAEQLPHVGNAGSGVHRARADLYAYFEALAERLRRVRVCCGDFERVLGPSVTWKHGLTAVFLDPPYDLGQRTAVYAEESNVAQRARAWAIANGDNPLLRIALCGYEGEHEMPSSWATFRWKAKGGYGSQGQGRGRENAGRETIWFSPACIDPAADWSQARRVADVALDDLPLFREETA